MSPIMLLSPFSIHLLVSFCQLLFSPRSQECNRSSTLLHLGVTVALIFEQFAKYNIWATIHFLTHFLELHKHVSIIYYQEMWLKLAYFRSSLSLLEGSEVILVVCSQIHFSPFSLPFSALQGLSQTLLPSCLNKFCHCRQN